ncbi:MAG: hypothetical protein ACOCXQ_02260 [Patescibacteria group bacterium]
MDQRTIRLIIIVSSIVLVLIFLTFVMINTVNRGRQEAKNRINEENLQNQPPLTGFEPTLASVRSTTVTLAPTSGYGTALTPGPGPTIFQDTELYQETFKEEAHQAQEELINKYIAVGDLKSELPYEGEYFILSYDYENLAFDLTLDTQNLTKAEEEFAQYLDDKNIATQEWLEEEGLQVSTDQL